ncbi:hypothetical protein [Verrucosispora sp. WMMD573]|uniref:hypothetical protein n=1 Tax=Verrucosispora sp. WMMD573 TaxID=3015149 RepID=UPI00248CBCAF|nr:hypothetical protein [Verrucosispora sp. WMMD573]WBB51991.1 hypothetical protein O7601_15310 [Verrucosispora sp. WMMD573]
MEQISRRRFLDEIVAVTQERQATTHLYLMLREGGAIGVQWEQPGLDQLREFRVIDPDGPVCPHCLIIEAVLKLAPVLPLDMLRTARARVQYERVLRAGMLPAPAFARQSVSREATWLGDCHGATGDPHTDADCAEHAAIGPSVVTDPLDVDPVAALPRGLLEVTDAADVRERLRLARDWRDTAAEVARRSRWAATTWGFLRSSAVLGVPTAGLPGMVYALDPGAPADDRPFDEVAATAMRSLSGRHDLVYADRVCLVPDPVPGGERMPNFAGAVDVAAGRPVRTLRLPSSRRPLSRLGRGILLLFEARHVMLIRHVQRDPDWESEAALHLFEFGMLEELGGPAYTSAVAAYLNALRREGELLARPQKVLDRRARRALAGIFGGLDDEELHLWASVAYRNAIMVMLGSQSAFAEHLRRQAS